MSSSSLQNTPFPRSPRRSFSAQGPRKSSYVFQDRAPPLMYALIAEGFVVTSDGRVSWTDEHPLHPRSWSFRRKVYDTGIMFMLELFTTLISNTGSLTAIKAHEELGISKEVAVVCFTTSYLLAQAVGSMLMAPFTESYGRKWTYIASTMTFAVATALVGLPTHIAGIVVGRVFSGLASAIPGVVIGGSIEEMWDIKARIWVVDFWVLSGVVGLAVAPSYATAVDSALGWKWIYLLAAIVAGVFAIATCFIKESRPSRILKTYLEQNYGGQGLIPHDTDIMPSFRVFVKDGLRKPLMLLFTEPILFVVTIMSASVYGFAYLLTEELPRIYNGFGYSAMQSANVYLFLCVGALLALSVRFFDDRYAERQERRGRLVMPEDKLLGFYIAAPLQALAFWVFAWTIPPHARHITSLISVVAIIPIGFALNEFDHVLTGYTVDTYKSDASSANAPVGALRPLLSAVLPIAATTMFENLGNNVAVSVIAMLATLYIGAAVAFYLRGRRLREASKLAEERHGRSGSEISLTASDAKEAVFW